MQTIKEILMNRDNMSSEEAENLIDIARTDLEDRLAEGEMPYNICEEWFGLEPDYIVELLPI